MVEREGLNMFRNPLFAAIVLQFATLMSGAVIVRAEESGATTLGHTVETETPYYRGGVKGLEVLGNFAPKTQLQLVEDAGKWSKVRDADGAEGWVATSALVKITKPTGVDGHNEFAFRLFRSAAKPGANQLLSPTSISSVLSVMRNGAKGQTRAEINSVLLLSDDQPPASMTHFLNRTGDGFEVRSVNHLWSKKGLRILPSFQESSKKQFAAEFSEIDFSTPSAAQSEINAWMSKNTNRMIPQLFTSISPQTQLVLANASYFKGIWQCRFQEGLTQNQQFVVSADETIEVPMMKLEGLDVKHPLEVPLLEAPSFKVISLPYKGDAFSAMFLLPDKNDGLDELEQQLTATKLTQWRASMKKQKVDVLLPKFTINSSFNLNETLSKLGLDLGSNPDLSGITAERLNGIELVHQARIQCDEKGTEAAAGSGLVAVGIKKLFRADHPFLFVICDNTSGAILFIGRVAKPEWQPLQKAS
jgi:serpin B